MTRLECKIAFGYTGKTVNKYWNMTRLECKIL